MRAVVEHIEHQYLVEPTEEERRSVMPPIASVSVTTRDGQIVGWEMLCADQVIKFNTTRVYGMPTLKWMMAAFNTIIERIEADGKS